VVLAVAQDLYLVVLREQEIVHRLLRHKEILEDQETLILRLIEVAVAVEPLKQVLLAALHLV
jgi:hypothetical protein